MPGRQTGQSRAAACPDGRDVLVLVALEPGTGETVVPLTVLTTLPDENAG